MTKEIDPAIKTEFENVISRSEKLELSVDKQLELYGLFKQAKFGDVTGKRPGRMKVRARAKFDAWTSRKGIPKEEAMKEYIILIDKLEENEK